MVTRPPALPIGRLATNATCSALTPRPTIATGWSGLQVRAAVRVALRAVSLHLHVGASRTAPNILLLRHHLKMVWIHAVPHAAEVIGLEPVRNGADTEFVGEAVSPYRRNPNFPKAELSISARIAVTRPQPAGGCELDLRPEAFCESRIESRHEVRPSCCHASERHKRCGRVQYTPGGDG
jgi:hypothetical protein